ncbi:MAG: SCP2 sterol-binding domain-containing protein [Deltaproteobacteria bacterium]|nr:SCP2 sterol-binding domain-containing protein [Deltaproteobacteria bacterium]
MPVFESTEKMYEVLGALFNHLMEHPDVREKFQAAGITVRFEINDPKGEIWLSPEDGVICGPCEHTPTVTMTLSGDSCHKFWKKELSLPVALAKRQIKSRGPINKILKLLPLLKPAYEAYPEIAKKRGIEA